MSLADCCAQAQCTVKIRLGAKGRRKGLVLATLRYKIPASDFGHFSLLLAQSIGELPLFSPLKGKAFFLIIKLTEMENLAQAE